jgi:hypothetical protein
LILETYFQIVVQLYIVGIEKGNVIVDNEQCGFGSADIPFFNALIQTDKQSNRNRISGYGRHRNQIQAEMLLE